MKITSMDRRSLQLTTDRVLAAIKTLESELGVKFSYKGGTYGTEGMIKLGIEVVDTGNGKSSGQLQYERYCAMWGMKPEWFGASFWENGTQYRLVGMNPGSPKYRLSIERVHDRKTFKATVEMVRRGMEKEVAIGRLAA